MRLGPGDIEIDEIGLEEIFEGIVPGSEPPTPQTQETETTNTAVDDLFGF